jgi:hypothetical protein
MAYRSPTRENATPQQVADSGHVLWCWEGDGPGARLRIRVDQAVDSMTQQIDGVARETRKELGTINKRLWYISGGIAVLTILAPVILGAWLSSRLAASEKNAIKRDDVEQLFRRNHEAMESRRFDDARLEKLAFPPFEANMPTGKAIK